MSTITFNNRDRLFFQSVKNAVDAYFIDNSLKKTGNWKLYIKAGVFIPFAIVVYIILLHGDYTTIAGLLLCIALGLLLSFIAFNVMHDACHGSYSSRRWVNNLMGLTMNALGSNANIWKIQHNIIHHTYTNIDGIDHDIDHWPLLRQCPTQQWRPYHRYQDLYMFLLYAVSTLAWMLVFDFEKYFTRKISSTAIKKMALKEHILFWVSKGLYVFFYIVLPVYFRGPQVWLAGFITLHIIMGLFVTTVFQLAHLVEKTSFEAAGNEPKTLPSEWAIHELMTTANFAPHNKIISWLAGGLNFQIEHHLFPRISHIHYPALSKIVQDECARLHLPYHCYPKLSGAIRSHIRLMQQFGKNSETVAGK